MSGTFQIKDAACAKCTFFDVGASAGPDLGLCRYNPPISQPGPNDHGLWPVVAGKDWCGHYQPKGA